MTTSTLLEVAGLTVRYGGVVAVDDVSFTVGPGEVVGLIGPNGAGKTSCIDALSGFQRPDQGRVTFDGRPLDGLAPHRRVARGFTRTFQSLELFEDLSVRENILVAASTPTWRATLADAFRMGRPDHAAVDEILDLLGLSEMAEHPPSHLSNGQRHLVALGRALAPAPSLVLLDEPAAGLDSAESVRLGEVLSALPDRGISVLLVDHDMALVLGVSHRIHVLDFGRLIASGTSGEIRTDPAVVAAYLGSAS